MRWGKRNRWLVVFLLPALFAGSQGARKALGEEGEKQEESSGWSPVPADPEAEIRIAKAEALAKRGEVARALDIYQEVIDQKMQCVVPLGKGIFVNHQELCHRKIVSLGPEALRLYRLKFDAGTKRMFESGVKEQDPRILKEIWRRFRCSSMGEKAVERAGDIHFDLGELRQALYCWEKGLRWQEENLFPPPPRLYAKIATLLKWLGETGHAREVIQRARDRFPKAKVRIAGEEVSFAELPDRPFFRTDPLVEKAALGRKPPTLTGRGASGVSGGLDLCWAWEHKNLAPEKIPERYARVFSRGTNSKISDAFPPSLPAVLEGCCVFKDGPALVALDFQSGKLKWRAKVEKAPERGQPVRIVRMSRGMAPLPAFGPCSVTANLGRVFAVDGDSGGAVFHQVGGGRLIFRILMGNQGKGTPGNRLVAWEAGTGKRLWAVGGEKEGKKGEKDGDFLERVRFLWAPTPVADRLYVPALYRDEVFLCCLDQETGKFFWRTCVLTRFGGGGNIFNPFGGSTMFAEISRVVVGEGICVLLSNRGTVAAVEADTGYLRWIAEYKSTTADLMKKARGRPGVFLNRRGPSQKKSIPSHPLIIRGRVFIAPADSPEIFCLRAGDGAVWWKTKMDNSGARYLLGVADGKMLVGGKTLTAFDVQTGKSLWGTVEFPDGPDGAGLLGDGVAYFPTGGFLYAIDLRGGKLVRRFGILPKSEFGHFTLAEGRLVISYPKKVVCYEFVSVGAEEGD